jgi:predicted nuclease of predicted toxin-antitoxin system
MMNFIVDMCLSPRWADALTEAGLDGRHWSSLGAANTPDSIIFDFARREGSVLLTAELDFGTLLAQTRSGKASVVQLRLPRIRFATAWPRTLQALQPFRGQIEAGALVTIDAATAKVRILPLR